MTSFEHFLTSRLAAGGFTTDDVLASFLPLLRQVVDAHQEGQVAPLAGLEDLRVDGVSIWYEEARLQAPKYNRAAVQRIERDTPRSLEVVGERRVELNAAGEEKVVDLRIGKPDQPIDRPLYLPGYLSWEHLLDHHDPLTDAFSLGMLLASLASGLNLSDDKDLTTFVSHRDNLFELRPALHPVVGRAILRLTELDRHRRPQDLAALLMSLENYGDQVIDFDVELAQVPDFTKKDLHGKQQIVLTKLQERLFEISRRNRLLHFRTTMHTVNLTHASVPLSFDVRSIRPDQILVWNEELQKRVASGRSISLNKQLNFHEAIYLPSLLDRIRLDAQRDKNEYGFAQLRLIACFLRWANLKESPPIEFESPLVLVPVELTKKKGVRDTYHIKSLEPIAEINPVLRHLFKQLYDIDLPESIDLEESSLDDLYSYLVRAIEASGSAVTVEKIDRPRIDLVHEMARRRLDQYRRRARLAGRGVRRFLDLDYSYDPANYHPLGLQLYNDRIRPRQTEIQPERLAGQNPRRSMFQTTVAQLEQISDAGRAARQFATSPGTPPGPEKHRTLSRLRKNGTGNPYVWEFDLCSVTLGNFKYRKMSLVRDYRALLDENPLNAAFDATFSLSPRPVGKEQTQPLELPQRFHVVACDPTQAAAIAESHSQNSYIIQGPPGTGKSQTITNLIADYVARGKRVLFVCEKRAAIDVVYHRLRQQGLDQLCCLIHDSQADKKEFVMDLKQTYERWLQATPKALKRSERKRKRIVGDIAEELAPLREHQATMTSQPPAAGVTVRELLDRLIELRDLLPECSPSASERLPTFAQVHTGRERLRRFAELLRVVQTDGVLARYPFRLINNATVTADRPIEMLSECLAATRETAKELVDALIESGLPEECCDSLEKSREVFRYATQVEFLARRRLVSLLRPDSDAARQFAQRKREFDDQRDRLRDCAEAASGWTQKLPLQDVQQALNQARRFEADWLRILKPSWWKLRSVLNRCYDFASHQIAPTHVQVLEWLEAEQNADQVLRDSDADLARHYELDGSFADFVARVSSLPQLIAGELQHLQQAHQHLIAHANADNVLVMLAGLAELSVRLIGQLDRFLTDYQKLSPPELLELLRQMENSLEELPDYLDGARELVQLPPEVAATLRANEWNVAELEAAAAQRSFDQVLRQERAFAKFNGRTLERQVGQLDRLTQDWSGLNAEVVCGRVQTRFLEHVKISTLPAAQLEPDQKSFKKQYSRGRRELEHEFAKTMRYKPIRDLVAGESGAVVKDLKPIWLMSPLSVSDTLPLDTEHFDVVIFDEASQIVLEEAVPSLYRANQTIVVGDEMQLPPTNFFSANRPDEEEQLQFEQDGELVEYDLASNSFLNHAARNLSSRMLGWHYRSRSESLISFSNWAFYRGQLLTVPEEELAVSGLAELSAATAEDAAANAAELLNRAVSFQFMEHGVYEKRRNRAEAEYIAQLVAALIRPEKHPTIGIVAFSEAQQDEIETALQRLAEVDRGFRGQLEAELEREEDSQFAGLLVKNLENIQGDERDVIIMSVCYAPDADGKMRMNFGPINQSGGEKRLNVAFSRAKYHMALVSSIRYSAITNDYNDGANCLKNYLHYAECCSVGDLPAAQQILQSMSLAPERDAPTTCGPGAVVAQLGEALRSCGYKVDTAVGQSQFRCDLAIRCDGDTRYRLGVLVDTGDYYAQSDLLERDLMKPNLLRAFGWQVAVVLAKDWWDSPEAVLERLKLIAGGGESSQQWELRDGAGDQADRKNSTDQDQR